MELSQKLRANRIEKLHARLLQDSAEFPNLCLAAVGIALTSEHALRCRSMFLRAEDQFSDTEGLRTEEPKRKRIEAFMATESRQFVVISDTPPESVEYETPLEILEKESGLVAMSLSPPNSLGDSPRRGFWFWQFGLRSENRVWATVEESENADSCERIVYGNEPFLSVEPVIRQYFEEFAAVLEKPDGESASTSFGVWFNFLATVYNSRIRKTTVRTEASSDDSPAPEIEGWTFNLPWNLFLSSAVALERWATDKDLSHAVAKRMEELSREQERRRTRSFLVSDLKDILEIDRGTLRKYAIKCEVDLPKGPGNRNFRYSSDSARKICLFIIDNASNNATIGNARRLLEELSVESYRTEILPKSD